MKVSKLTLRKEDSHQQPYPAVTLGATELLWQNTPWCSSGRYVMGVANKSNWI